jgi:hypothetical protein
MPPHNLVLGFRRYVAAGRGPALSRWRAAYTTQAVTDVLRVETANS